MSGRVVIIVTALIVVGIVAGAYVVYRGTRTAVQAEMRTLVADLQKFVDDEKDRL